MEHDYEGKNLADKVALVGELEHIRRHALRSASVSLYNAENIEDDVEKDKAMDSVINYLVVAKKARDYRRAFMNTQIPKVKDEDWCLIKSAATLRQISYEINEGNAKVLVDIDNLCDGILSEAFGVDMSGCAACNEDKKGDTIEEEEKDNG